MQLRDSASLKTSVNKITTRLVPGVNVRYLSNNKRSVDTSFSVFLKHYVLNCKRNLAPLATVIIMLIL